MIFTLADGAWPSEAFARSVVPIFEYICSDCGKKFEAILYGSKQAQCPSCQSSKLEQQLSVFAVAGGREAKSSAADFGGGPCGTCGHPGGPGACAFDEN
jgi:putative FmdB family regulatory protein